MQTDDAPIFRDADDLFKYLGDVLAGKHDTHEQIDDSLRKYLDATALNRCLWLDVEDDEVEDTVAACAWLLLRSELFSRNKPYVRRQYIYCILQEDDLPILHLTAAILLADGRDALDTFQMMQAEGAFSRLLDLLRCGAYHNTPFHKLLLDLLCDMSRIQRLSPEDLGTVDDGFIIYLFELIEQHSNDAGDPYHYTVIRLLLVLNEQYMCADSDLDKQAVALEPSSRAVNRIVAILSHHGPSYRTFGENLILLLNRETGLGPQLLILKMLYLLFTNASTFEYFYTNDLHVLVDVMIRNLLDLDMGGSGYEQDRHDERHFALRHTYLRVLYPLLRNTQLSFEGAHYKRNELRKLFYLLVSSDSRHFAPVDETVHRLVSRCKQIDWISDPSDIESRSPSSSDLSCTMSGARTTAKNKLLGMQLAEEGVSNLSVVSVAAQVEKRAPAIPPPRRRGKMKVPSGNGDGDGVLQLQVPLSLCGTTPDRVRSPFADETNEPWTA